MTRLVLLAAALAASAGCNKSNASKPAPAAAAATPAQPPAAGTLQIVVNGKPAGVWTTQQIAAAGTVSMNNQNGEQRDGWPLAKVAQSLVGPKAHVVALANADERVAVDDKDPNKTLVLRLNHRGAFKAHWAQGGNTDEAFLKGVQRVEIAN